MKKLLTLTAVLESGTGIGILIIPSVVTTFLLGSPVDSRDALVISQISGIALIVIGIVCWLNRNGEQNKFSKGMAGAIGFYNFGVIAVFLILGLSSELIGVGLWPIVIAHVVMGIWCITLFLKT